MDERLLRPAMDGIDGAREWFGALVGAGIAFHPDGGFVDDEGASRYEGITDADAALLDAALDRAVALCEAEGLDAHAVAWESYADALGIAR